MAVSKKRDKAVYKPPRKAGKEKKNPAWFTPTMTAFYVIGMVWILVYYISQAVYPLPIDNGNLLVGFGFITVGFLMTTRWK
ncbi:MAG: cell division protein CrgA [Demequinaceae bacterium]|nr:cell division protein CrgA [Demequinaceae bacterium]